MLITAPASGHGKTSVTAAIASYHSRSGLKVRCFKTGPDFIDPTLLAKASGQPVYNLDSWIMGAEHCRQLLFEAAREADLILVEGVMGLFDGEPSSADLAELFGLPIVPVIDASKMAQTFAALLHGLTTFRPSLKVAGAVANRVGSARHAELLQTGIPARLPLACIKRQPQVSLPSRHLGLHLADEIDDIDQQLDGLADALADTWLAQLPAPVTFKPNHQFWEYKIPFVLSLSKDERNFVSPPHREIMRRFMPLGPSLPPLLQNTSVAVARDRAFCFLYQQNLLCLQQLGARLVFFSPLQDSQLPQADAVYLPGGYPELYADQLAANLSLKADLRQHVANNKPLLAECGGMLYVLEHLIDKSGNRHAMLGLLAGEAKMQDKLTAIGSQQLQLDDEKIRGHTFHYSSAEVGLTPVAIGATVDGRTGEALYRSGSLTASYLHFYFPSNPGLVAKWLTGFTSQSGSHLRQSSD